MTLTYGAYALYAVKPGYMYVRACTRPRARVPTRTHAGDARTHGPISNACCFSTGTMISECASVFRYTYIAPIIYLFIYGFDVTDHAPAALLSQKKIHATVV